MTAEVGLLIGFFLFMLVAVSAAGYIFVLRPSDAVAREGEIPAALAGPEAAQTSTKGLLIRTFRLLGEAMPGASNDSNPLRKRLAAAGYRWPTAVPIFHGIKLASALLVGVVIAWVALALQNDLWSGLLPFFCGFGFGYMMPERVLDRIATSRRDRLRRALPAAMDLMILSIEAGQALDQAVVDASRGLKVTFPDLADELTLMHLELRASNSRSEAIRNFAERNNDLELRKLANLLLDTDRFGTSLGPALRTHAKYLRIRFRQKAQERARKIGVKLVFPVFFLIFPSVILVTLGPAVILITTQMKTLLGP